MHCAEHEKGGRSLLINILCADAQGAHLDMLSFQVSEL